MGSGAETARETADALQRAGEKVGVLQVRLFRPFSAAHFLAPLPPTCRAVAVLEQTKEPGAGASRCIWMSSKRSRRPSRAASAPVMPRVIGGRYGLSSKDFSPAMAKAVFDELKKPAPQNGFTVGINDDVSHTSLDVRSDVFDRARRCRARSVLRPGCRRHGGRQQEQRQDHRRGCRAVCPGLFRLRFAQVRRADRVASALRAAPDPLALSDQLGEFHRLPSVPFPEAPGRAARSRHRAPLFCSTVLMDPTRCGIICPARCSSRSSRSSCGFS